MYPNLSWNLGFQHWLGWQSQQILFWSKLYEGFFPTPYIYPDYYSEIVKVCFASWISSVSAYNFKVYAMCGTAFNSVTWELKYRIHLRQLALQPKRIPKCWLPFRTAKVSLELGKNDQILGIELEWASDFKEGKRLCLFLKNLPL